MKINDNLMKYIQEEAEHIQFGRVTIELNENTNRVAVVSEKRKHFPLKPGAEGKEMRMG